MEYGRATIVEELRSLELRPPQGAAAAVYDQAIGIRLLHEDPRSGEEHYLVRYPQACGVACTVTLPRTPSWFSRGASTPMANRSDPVRTRTFQRESR